MLIWPNLIGQAKIWVIRCIPLSEVPNSTIQRIRKLDWQQAVGFGGRK